MRFFFNHERPQRLEGYEYNDRNRLVWISDEKERPVEITYDSLGRRTEVNYNGEVTKYQYIGESDKVAKEIRPDGTEISFTYNNEGRSLTMTVNGNTYYYVSNGRGDVIALTDANGAKAASYRYDPWGRELKTDEETATEQAGISKGGSEIGKLNPYRYAGYRYDSKLKLYFLKTRYYDPQLGRFLSRDTYKGDDIEKVAIAQNKYVYANNNPVNMTDPNGQKAVSSKNPKSGTKPKAKSPSKPKPKSTPSSKHDTKKSNTQKKPSKQQSKQPSKQLSKQPSKQLTKQLTKPLTKPLSIQVSKPFIKQKNIPSRSAIIPQKKESIAREIINNNVSNSNINLMATKPGYKGFSWGQCTWYAAMEFDKKAPKPGHNWRGDGGKWFSNASAAGWVTKTSAKDAVVGAIICWRGGSGGYGHVGIVKSVNSTGITVSESHMPTLGKITSCTLTFNNLSRKKLIFQGYILPKRK